MVTMTPIDIVVSFAFRNKLLIVFLYLIIFIKRKVNWEIRKVSLLANGLLMVSL